MESDTQKLLAQLLGALVDQQGGVVHIDKIAFEKFRNDKFYAIKLDFEDEDIIILEVLDEDPTEASVGKDSDKS
jgi:hypothetical protein